MHLAFRAEKLWHTCRHQLRLVTHRREGTQGHATRESPTWEKFEKAWLSMKAGGFFWLCPTGSRQEKGREGVLVLTGLMRLGNWEETFLGVNQRRPEVVSPEVSVANVQSALVMEEQP